MRSIRRVTAGGLSRRFFSDTIREVLNLCLFAGVSSGMSIERTVTFTIPEAVAARVERIEGDGIDEVAKRLLFAYCKDGRRTGIPVKKISVEWHTKLYEAMIAYCGRGEIARYVRGRIHAELSKTQKNLLDPPDWADHLEGKPVRAKVRPTTGRSGFVCPIIIPAEWYEVLSVEFPKRIGPWIKSIVQLDLEAKTGKKLPVQKGMREFIGRDE